MCVGGDVGGNGRSKRQTQPFLLLFMFEKYKLKFLETSQNFRIYQHFLVVAITAIFFSVQKYYWRWRTSVRHLWIKIYTFLPFLVRPFRLVYSWFISAISCRFCHISAIGASYARQKLLVKRRCQMVPASITNGKT